MIAQYYLDTGQNLEEAIRLCKTGINTKFADESTLYGYFILTNIYAKLGDKGNFDYYTREGDKLNNLLLQKKK